MDYTGKAKTSEFKVVNEAEFVKWAWSLPGGGAHKGVKPGTWMVTFDGGIPTEVFSDEDDDFVSLNLIAEIRQYMADGEVVVITEAGSMGFRYMHSHVLVVTHDADRHMGMLDVIAHLKKEMGLS